jgi:hypothetical protein
MVYPPTYAFYAEYLTDDSTDDKLDEYFRTEFKKRHPGWEPRFGKATWFDRQNDRYSHMYLLSGSVPEAKSQEDAEARVRNLLAELGDGLKKLGKDIGAELPKPHIRVWRWPS